MIGFDELSTRLATNQGIGRLLGVKKIRRLSNISGNDLLECEDFEVLSMQFESGMLHCLAKGMMETCKVKGQPPFRGKGSRV